MWRNTLLEHNISQWPFKKSKHSTLDSQDFRITHLGVTHYSSTSFSLVNITPPSLIGQVEHPQISDVHCYLPFHFWLQNDLVPCSCSCSWLCPLLSSTLPLSLVWGSGQRPPEGASPWLDLQQLSRLLWVEQLCRAHSGHHIQKHSSGALSIWSWMWGHLEVVVTSVIWYHINCKMGREMSRHGN